VNEPRQERGALIALAIPLAFQQMGVQVMGLVDSALLGHYSDSALAGSGVGNYLLFAITAVALGIVMGLDTVVPQRIGADRIDAARRALASGIRLAVAIGLAAMLVVIVSPEILRLTDTPADVSADARIYVYARSFGVVPFLLTIAMRSYLAARSTTRPLVIAVIAANVLNALLDLVLIFGVEALGIPSLGVIGAAIATVVSQIGIVVVYWIAIRGLDEDKPLPSPSRDDMREIVGYGLPVGGQLLAEIGAFSVSTILAAHLGKLPAAAHMIALTLSSFTFSLALGISNATSVRVGHAIGAGDRELARRRGLIGVRVGLAIMAGFAVAFLIGARPLAQLFTDDAAVIVAAIPLLQIAALFQLSDGTQVIAAGALRGLGETRATFVGSLIGYYGIGFAVMLGLAFGAGMGAPGLWWGLSAGLTATAVYFFVRFLRATR
jgi:MATE family multidrug resistance protein